MSDTTKTHSDPDQRDDFSDPDGAVVIRTIGLTKHYGDLTAVDSLNLTIHRGEVYGLLGPNGAGKTTTILMLLGLTDRSAGQVEVLGFDPARRPLSVKSRVGYLPDQIGFYDDLSAWENLFFIARLNGISRSAARQRIDAALLRMGLADVAGKPVKTFSRGMRQRLGVAELLLKQPQVIMMDEPTLGLDPEAARQFLRMIQDLKHEGIAILLSSHLLHQVQAVCDRVGLFQAGKLVLEGSVSELAQRVQGGAYRIHLQATGANGAVDAALHRLPNVVDVRRDDDTHYVVEASTDLRAEAAAAVVSAQGRLLALDMEAPSLDEIYASYFQEVNDDGQN